MKSAKPAKDGDDAIYIGIEDPVTLRRNLLESSKALVHILKGNNSLKDLRAAKHRMIEELRTRITQINELVSDARQLMPQTDKLNLPSEEEKRAAKTAAKAAVQIKPKPAPQQHIETHVDKFERELQDIEKKLKAL